MFNFSVSISSALLGKNIELIRAMPTKLIRIIAGVGLSSSATSGAPIVMLRATKLQIPIEVALVLNGKMTSSLYEAWYTMAKFVYTHILVRKIQRGMTTRL